MTRRALPLSVLGGLTVVALACDPNVVIGAKWRAGENVAGTAGNSGVSGSGGASSGGVGAGGGSEPNPEAGAPSVVGGMTSSEAGAAGEAGAVDDSILFEATHEDGSLVIWDEGPDMDAGGYYADAMAPRFSDEVAHSGTGSAEVTIDTSAGDTIARLYRRIEHDAAYYSAWFYLREDHTPSKWWSIFLFRAVKDRNDSIDLWDIDLIRDGDKLTFSIYDHRRSEISSVPSKPVIPIQQWFHVEAYLELGRGKPSRIDYWLDGEPLLSLPELSEVPEGEPIYWVIGNGGSTLTPPVSTIYVDDAIVSKARVGVP